MGARFLILASLLLAMSGTAFATDEQLALTCYANSSSNTNMPTFASPVNPYETGYYETSFGSNDTATGGGFHVANTTDKEVDCMWVVPPNYDTSAGSPPYIVVYGWFEATDTCYSSCPSFEYVRLKVASRVYNTGPLNASQSSDVNGDIGIASSGTSPKLYKQDTVMISSPIDATAAASDWAPGRLVFIRLRRDTSVTNNQPSTFYLASVQLVYTPL